MDCLHRLVEAWTGPPRAAPISSRSVDLLLLGTGWTGSFLLPIAADAGFRTASTTRDGSNGTIPFHFDPDVDGDDDLEQYMRLPNATTVVIIFPLYDGEHSKRLVRSYERTRDEDVARPRFILLGSTGIYNNGSTLQAKIAWDSPKTALPPMTELKGKLKKHQKTPRSPWIDRNSEYDTTNPRAAAEDAFLALSTASPPSRVSVLCLSGLWGHGRSPRRFIAAMASSKQRLRALGSLSLVHGRDVVRAILAMHSLWARAEGQRWVLTNDRYYDFWDLASRWGGAGEAGRNHPPRGPQGKWVQELMAESQQQESTNNLVEGLDEDENTIADKGAGLVQGPYSSTGAVRALPRTPEQCGEALDSSEFWRTFDLVPAVPWVD
ncbi:hypothetical protein K437DRAFT_256531 [Tilletiaria anomala UBC 951]|uniref:Uncharacterized protein n=1 Tax=Tilletiaria anomala (strain ATCC 24038 / CBS 436.72 / UBC 951) TaxID=1037660 RepID=A0A066VV46_TILAU|nr:uncharacterized protein K437DRAFT_256531 [Tilletiaria anomala UBC 951]KDN45607.1 hypothetical protein K437DRAFT_256531 [Tilletiaria anomala UBC 951]